MIFITIQPEVISDLSAVVVHCHEKSSIFWVAAVVLDINEHLLGVYEPGNKSTIVSPGQWLLVYPVVCKFQRTP